MLLHGNGIVVVVEERQLVQEVLLWSHRLSVQPIILEVRVVALLPQLVQVVV